MKLSNSFRVTEVKKKTRHKGFSQVAVGDIIDVSYTVNGGYHSSPYVNVKTKEGTFGKYSSEMQSLLAFNFSVEPYKEPNGDAEDALKYRKLEAYGVDNWSGYGMAMSDEEGIFE
ncbi:hypothetical protein R1C46_26440 [Bacillus tropicus]